MLVASSPKSQLHEVAFVESSVNAIVSGTAPEVADAVKAATGAIAEVVSAATGPAPQKMHTRRRDASRMPLTGIMGDPPHSLPLSVLCWWDRSLCFNPDRTWNDCSGLCRPRPCHGNVQYFPGQMSFPGEFPAGL